MSDVGIKFRAAIGVVLDIVTTELHAALIAITRLEMVLAAAFVTIRSQLAAGHGNKGTAVAFNDLQIADHEAPVKGNAAESAQAVLWILH